MILTTTLRLFQQILSNLRWVLSGEVSVMIPLINLVGVSLFFLIFFLA